MGEDKFLALNQLFDSIGVIEKGIEKIYHYLLLNKRIDDLKKVCGQFGLTLKRGYKISSVLSDLELVQTYDRPMKIILQTPVIPVWQRIINNRIEHLKKQFDEHVKECENTFENFTSLYDLQQRQIEQEPVEFINYSLENIEDIYYPFLASEQCRMAIGIRYDNVLISTIKDQPIDIIQKQHKANIIDGMEFIANNVQKIDIKVVFNEDLIENLLYSKEYRLLKDLLKNTSFKFKSFDVRIAEENFSNFSIVDDELIQPSFDPSYKLMGAYVSRNRNIYQVFADKFEDLFQKGISINEYIQKNDNINFKDLSDFESFVLCLL